MESGDLCVLSWNKLGQGPPPCGRTYVEVEGELCYRDFTPAESDRSVRIAEVYASSILLLDRFHNNWLRSGCLKSRRRNQPMNRLAGHRSESIPGLSKVICTRRSKNRPCDDAKAGV